MDTISNRSKPFTQRQIKDAERAKRLLGFFPQHSLQEMLSSGAIINCPVTLHDVVIAGVIYGPDLAAVRGKTTRKPSVPIRIEHLPRAIPSVLNLSVDLVCVEGSVYLASVS